MRLSSTPARRMVQPGLLGTIAVLLLAACSASSAPTPASFAPSASPYSLSVADVDGPPIDILIAGRLVAEVSCSGYTTLRVGQGGVPPLPWSLDVRQQGGGLMQHFDVVGGEDFMLLVRGDSVSLGHFGSAGPTTAPNACARWG